MPTNTKVREDDVPETRVVKHPIKKVVPPEEAVRRLALEGAIFHAEQTLNYLRNVYNANEDGAASPLGDDMASTGVRHAFNIARSLIRGYMVKEDVKFCVTFNGDPVVIERQHYND